MPGSARTILSKPKPIIERPLPRNPPTNRSVTGIQVRDILPRELSYVRADGDREWGSYDDKNHEYVWRYPSLEAGRDATVKLVVKVGDQVAHDASILNRAEVSSADTGPSSASFETAANAAPPIVASTMYTKPNHIYRNNPPMKAELMVVVHLPQGIGSSAINPAPLVMTPGNGQGTGQYVFGTAAQGKVLCFFDTASLLAATPGVYGEQRITVRGQLNDGRLFEAHDTIWILKFAGQ